MRVAILRPSESDLVTERERLLGQISIGEDELRARAADYLVTAEESRVLRRLNEIRFLLGDDD